MTDKPDASAPLPPLQQIPSRIVALDDYAEFARERMSAQAWAYISGGAGDESTLQENRAAFQRLSLRNRVLADMSGGHTRLNLLGQELAYPMLLAPVAYQKLVHAQGELATVTAAAAMGAGMVVSTQASASLEDIAQAAQAPLWFQLYIQPDRGFVQDLVRRAEVAGYTALVVTVDAPVNGPRNREQRAAFQLPPGVDAVNLRGMQGQAAGVAQAGTSPLFGSGFLHGAPVWKDLAWLRALTTLPILLKGVMTPEDAQMALRFGMDGLIVSNHGGRVLDTQPATITALPAIAHAVNGQAPLLLDGGIRRGTDVLKALALGASAVMIGRPYIYGLATAGAVGVAHVLHMLRTELEMAMVLTGCPTLADISPAVLQR